jgi:Dolichyl-phosphate-mannose-protein mannosyltransferase
MSAQTPSAIDRRIDPRVVGALVFLCALVLRVSMLSSARFGGDEALFFHIGMDIVEGVRFPLLGTQLTDGQARLPGPAFLYLLAAPLLVFRGPEAQFLFVEVLGAVTVWMFWAAMRRPFGEAGAALAGLLMAFAPWSALYGDRTWNPNVSPFFVVLALWAALRVREDPRSRWLLVFLPTSALLAQLHMSAPVAWAGLLVVVLPVVKKIDRRNLAIGVGLALLLYVPFIVHELSSGFSNTKNLLAETLGEKKESHPGSFLWIPVYALRFLTLDAMYHELSGYWGGPDEWKNLRALFIGTAPRPFHLLRVVALACSLGLALTAIGVAARDALRRYRATRALPWLAFAFLAALIVNLLLLGMAGKQVFGHYVNNLLPFVFVAYAALGRGVKDEWPRTRAFGVAVAVLALVFAVGGAEVTLAISKRVDGRIGLRVHRETLARIRADGEREGNASEPVRLDVTYFPHLYSWTHYAARAMKWPVRFDKRASTRHYLLVKKGDERRAPRGAEGPVDVGYALLYRVRTP